MNHGVEAGGDQFIESADIAEVAGIELDALGRTSESLWVQIIDADVMLFGEELIDDMGSQKTRPAED